MRPVHEQWIDEIRALAQSAVTSSQFFDDLLRWSSKLPDASYSDLLGDALALAQLKGQSEIIDEIGSHEFSEPKLGTVKFSEAVEFFRQKISMPTHVWTDTLHQAHDRAFVIAGADSVSLVEDIRGALDRAMNGGGGLEAFRKNFDDIVLQHGWNYNGGRNWRTRVIYETNLRTAHQAGRLKQMRDPDVIKLRPFWKYVHAEAREPKIPRPEHVAWDGLVLRHDDPIWSIIYPPNGWRCSCGAVTVSMSGLKRLGKDGPDTAPVIQMKKVQDPTTGEFVYVPEGIDFGWGYQPGQTWERGLVPREWQKPLALTEPELPLPVSPELDVIGRPFASPELPKGRDLEYYVDRFLNKFGAAVGRGVIYRDLSGHAVLISDDLFKNFNGEWKALKRGREIQMERMAEAIFDPDEIWVDWGDDPNGYRRLVRRYLRWDPQLAAYSAFEWSSKGWSGLTSFDPRAGQQQKPSRSYLEKQRRGALLYRRGEK